MLKKLMMAAALVLASTVSFQVGQGGTTAVKVPAEAAACNPSDYPGQPCPCGCCYNCWLWGSSCPECGD